jgi:hypothetical protein
MKRGRRTTGTQLLERLPGSTEAKRRLGLILETLSGRRTVTAAGQILGISRRRFHALRTEFLRWALPMLEPRPVGRPGREQIDDRTAGLQAEIEALRVELRATQIREELALTMPHLLRRKARSKKTKPKTARRRKSLAAERPAMSEACR